MMASNLLYVTMANFSEEKMVNILNKSHQYISEEPNYNQSNLSEIKMRTPFQMSNFYAICS